MENLPKPMNESLLRGGSHFWPFFFLGRPQAFAWGLYKAHLRYLWVSGRSGVSSATAFAAPARGWQLLRADLGMVVWVLRGSGPHVRVGGPHRASEYTLVKANPWGAVEEDCVITYGIQSFQAGTFTQLTSHTANNQVSTSSEGWKPCGSFSLTTKQLI